MSNPFNKLGQRLVDYQNMFDDEKPFIKPKPKSKVKPKGISGIPVQIDLGMYDQGRAVIENMQKQKTSTGLNYMMGLDDEQT